MLVSLFFAVSNGTLRCRVFLWNFSEFHLGAVGVGCFLLVVGGGIAEEVVLVRLDNGFLVSLVTPSLKHIPHEDRLFCAAAGHLLIFFFPILLRMYVTQVFVEVVT